MKQIILLSLLLAVLAIPAISSFASISTLASLSLDKPVKMLLQQSSGGFPQKHQPITVANLGNVPFQAESKYGTAVMWHGHDESVEVLPGETIILPMPNLFYVSALKVIINVVGRAILYAERGSQPMGIVSANDRHKNKPKFEHEAIEITRDLASRVTEEIPFVGMFIATFIDVFFADEKEDPWDEVKNKVKALITRNKLEIINEVLEKDIAPLEGKINYVMSQKNETDFGTKLNILILNFLDFDEKFIFKHGNDVREVNYYVLPLYSRSVNMMLSFYTWCIKYQKELALNDNAIKILMTYRQNAVNRAKKHIMNMYRDRIINKYNNLDVDEFYDSLMKTRTYITIHGLEYIPYWDYIIEPEKYPTVYQNFIAYSEYFGRQSISLNKQALVEFGNEPLTPNLLRISDDRDLEMRNELVRVQILLGFDSVTLVGAKLFFKNKATYIMGHGGYWKEEFYLSNDTRIMKIEACGTGKVDNLRFHLSDGRILSYGKFCGATRKVFEMEKHYICSFYVANDVKGSLEQLQNIAVAYQLLPVEILTSKPVNKEELRAQNLN